MASQEGITLIVDFAGQGNNVTPRLCRLECLSATITEVAAAGFLDNYLRTANISLLPTDFIFAVASNGAGIFNPVFTNGSCQLVSLI